MTRAIMLSEGNQMVLGGLGGRVGIVCRDGGGSFGVLFGGRRGLDIFVV